MPIHVPAPTQPTNKCPKCGSDGVAQQTVGNMTSYLCPKCGARWTAAS
jgi:DNA-directed RNA polymerase subunit RPC12/RpoP